MIVGLPSDQGQIVAVVNGFLKHGDAEIPGRVDVDAIRGSVTKGFRGVGTLRKHQLTLGSIEFVGNLRQRSGRQVGTLETKNKTRSVHPTKATLK